MPIQTIVCINEQLLIYGCHIDDVITSLRRGSEIGNFFQIKANTSWTCLKIYNKHDGFDFDIVNFPFPRRTSYGVYISYLIRFSRVW